MRERRDIMDSVTVGDGTPRSDLYLLVGGDAPRRLVEGRRSEPIDPEHDLVAIDNLRFSPDGARIYFRTDGWATSAAAHVVEVATGRERFLFDGVTIEVMPSGNLVAVHYRLQWNSKGVSEGRKEVWTLNDADGRELRKLPDDEKARAKMIRAL